MTTRQLLTRTYWTGMVLVLAAAPTLTYACTYHDVNGKAHDDGVTGGILVPCLPASYDFKTYLSELLRQNTVYILLVAILIIIASGVEYLFALGSSSAQAKAKQRIVGVVTGIIFFTLIRVLVVLLAKDITL